MSRALYRDSDDFDSWDMKVQEFQATLPSKSYISSLDDGTDQGWNYLHLWCFQMRILILYPLAEYRSSALTEAAEGIRSTLLEIMEPPTPIGVFFQTCEGFDLLVHNMLSPKTAHSTSYLRQSDMLQAWLNEKRRAAVMDLRFWVTLVLNRFSLIIQDSLNVPNMDIVCTQPFFLRMLNIS